MGITDVMAAAPGFPTKAKAAKMAVPKMKAFSGMEMRMASNFLITRQDKYSDEMKQTQNNINITFIQGYFHYVKR
jgi:hypothetical protein